MFVIVVGALMAIETLDIILGMVAGHLLGDFFLQTDLMVKNKRQFGVLVIHAAIVTAVSYLICGAWVVWPIVVGVFISHIVIDGLKVLLLKDGPKAFLLDQGAHLGVLVIIGNTFVSGDIIPFWEQYVPFYSKILLLLIGGLFSVQVGGYWVGKAIIPFQKSLENNSIGLPSAGRLIGHLERALIYLLVLAGEPQSVGFLMTAKSILRFGEIKEAGQKKEAEYIIIGTLMSFGWALLVAFVIKYLLDYI